MMFLNARVLPGGGVLRIGNQHNIPLDTEKNIKGSFREGSAMKRNPSGAPSVLIAYGNENAEILRTAPIKGAYIENWEYR